VLLDPFEEQFHLAAVLVEFCDGERGQVEVVGQKDKALAGLGMEVTHASQLVGIILLGASHKKGAGLMEFVKASEIDITPVHQIGGARFEEELVEDVDIVNSPMSNNNKGGNAPAQIQEHVKFDGGLVFPKFRPREKSETEIDGGGVQSVSRLVEFQPEIVVVVDPPRPGFVGVGESAVRNSTPNSSMLKFGFHRSQASFDIA